jgi:hypothetical protein
MDPKQPKPWLGKYDVLDEEHHGDLDARAAVHEFRNKLPMEEAQAKAHGDYLRDHALRAAAHHLVGTRAAHAAGNMETAHKHGAQYVAAMEAAGEDPRAQPPKEVLDHVKDAKMKLVTFKSHPADRFFPVAEDEATDDDAEMAGKLDKLKQVSAQLKAKS